MSLIKNSWNELKDNRFLALLMIISLFLCQFMLQFESTNWPRKLMLLVGVVGLIVLLLTRNKGEGSFPLNSFIIISCFGIANALILPVKYDLDENTHYYHALTIADGNLRSMSDERDFLNISPDFLGITKLPSKAGFGSDKNANLYLDEFLELKNKPSDYQQEGVKPGGFKNPAYYLMAAGIAVSRVFSDNLALSYYVGRIFNVLTYALLAFLAIKTSKNYRSVLFLVALVPYAMWITAGYNYDSIYYGIALCAVAQLVNFFSGKSTLTTKSGFIYILTCSIFVFCKAPAILLAAIPLFLSKDRFKAAQGRLLYLLQLAFGFLLAGAWLLQGTILKALNMISPTPPDPAVPVEHAPSVIERVIFFLNNLLYTLAVLARTFSEMVASIVNSISRPQPFFMPHETLDYINLFIFISLFLLVTLSVNIKINVRMRVIIWLVALVITGGMFFAITGDPRVFKFGDLYIAGVQGRYHFYLLCLLPLLLTEPLRRVVSFVSGQKSLVMDKMVVDSLLVKGMILITFLNTAIAAYGYL